MMSPRFTSVYGRMCLETGPEGEKASLSTSRWSPISSVSSIDPVGITKAWTRLVVPNNSRMMVTAHSAMKPRGRSGGALAGSSEGSGSATSTFSGSTAIHSSEILVILVQDPNIRESFSKGFSFEHNCHDCHSTLRSARPPEFLSAGVRLHDPRLGGAVADQDRHESGPLFAASAGAIDRHPADCRLHDLRHQHADDGPGAQERGNVVVVPDHRAHLCVDHPGELHPRSEERRVGKESRTR